MLNFSSLNSVDSTESESELFSYFLKTFCFFPFVVTAYSFFLWFDPKASSYLNFIYGDIWMK